MHTMPFDTVLIANRGEIAARIIKTLRKLGLRSAVVYHEVDARSPAVFHGRHSDSYQRSHADRGYLDIAQIIAAAHKAGAGAVRPGYGFLSEQAQFATAVIKAGIAFIGPAPETIELMGDKIRARSFVQSSGFPVVPSAN